MSPSTSRSPLTYASPSVISLGRTANEASAFGLPTTRVQAGFSFADEDHFRPSQSLTAKAGPSYPRNRLLSRESLRAWMERVWVKSTIAPASFPSAANRFLLVPSTPSAHNIQALNR